MSLKMAKASPSEIDSAIELGLLFQATVDRRRFSTPEIDGVLYDEDDEEYTRKFYEKCKELAPGLMRVVFGYQVLVDNCCDKSADHLRWHPEIMAQIKAGERSISGMMNSLRDMNRS